MSSYVSREYGGRVGVNFNEQQRQKIDFLAVDEACEVMVYFRYKREHDSSGISSEQTSIISLSPGGGEEKKQ